MSAEQLAPHQCGNYRQQIDGDKRLRKLLRCDQRIPNPLGRFAKAVFRSDSEQCPEIPCNLSALRMKKHFPSAVLVKPDGLTPQQENFARYYAEHGNAISAYKFAYAVTPTTNRNSLRASSYNILNNDKVRARVAALQAAMSERAVVSTAELIADLEALCSADVNEIMSLTIGACRHCWGINGGYQWRDAVELGRACDEAMAAGKPLPSMAGGFGYRSDCEPNPECSMCDGAGQQRVRFTSTAELSPAARKLFKGVELYGDGSVKKVLLHDQLAVRMELHRIKGMHIERSMSVTAHVNVPALKDMTNEQALDFLESLRPTHSTAPALPAPIEHDQ